jgi:hypothetical protein
MRENFSLPLPRLSAGEAGPGDFAQAGGTRKEGLKEALNKIYSVVETG